jgi:hypothetical protein
MDCKAVQRTILDIGNPDEKALDKELRSHISSCRECQKEWNWIVALHRDLKCLAVPKPEPEFWEAMPRRIQCKLMVGNVRGPVSASWVQSIYEWISRPRLAYGFTALAAACIIAIWATPFWRTPQLSPTASSKYEAGSYSIVPTASLDPTTTRSLDSLNDAELNRCVTRLIRQAFDRRELATIASDPVVLTENNMNADDGISHLGNRELKQVAYLLNQKYPR